MRIFAVTFLCFGIIFSSAASAQMETPLGSRIPEPAPARPDFRSKLPETEQARAMVDDFARCTLQYSAKAVDKAVASAYGAPGSTKALSDLARPRCLRNATLRMPPELLRGALFRAKILKVYTDEPIRFAENAFDYMGLVTDTGNPNQMRFVALQDFASCVVRSAPDSAAAFVVEEAGSEREQEALTTLIPALGPCLVEGLELEFSKSMLSAKLAEALFRELEAGHNSEESNA